MNLKAQAVKNVSSSWLGLAVHAVVGFFLSPFILHRLGDEAFSIWILVFALTGHLSLLDMGVRSSIVKLTAQCVATNDREELSRYLSTSLAFYAVIALIILTATAAGSVYVTVLFRIPAALARSARLLFMLSGISVAVTFPLGVFAGVLEGLQKFSWLQISGIAITLLRAILIVIALQHRGGLMAVGVITIAVSILSYLLFAGLASRALPVRFSIHNVQGAAFRNMIGYGALAFAILAAEKLRFQSDAMVIGAFLSSTAIASFSIGSRLVEFSSYAVRSMSQIFTPMSSQFDAARDFRRLQRTFLAGNRACALITFPLCVTLIVLGKRIIEAWVGAKYLSSYSVLLLLIVPRSLYLAQSTSIRVLLGMGRHRVLASALLLEGGLNLMLSLILVRPYGILGVALGTALPLACTSLLFLPRHLCRTLDVPLATFLKRAYGLPLSLCAPLVCALWLLDRQHPAHTYQGIVLQLACGGIVYVAGLACVLVKGAGPRLISWQTFSQLLEPGMGSTERNG